MNYNSINDPSGVDIKWNGPDINNIHSTIKTKGNFCVWTYQNIDNRKPSKVPYGLVKKNSDLIPSLKNEELWMKFEDLSVYEFPKNFQPGLILTKSPFTVIDIDNYQAHHTLDNILYYLNNKGAYLEISPSGKGLHIIFLGSWDYSRNKGDKILIVEDPNKLMTCEVYSGKDIRFITLTGYSLFNSCSEKEKPLAVADDLTLELKALYGLFFSDESISKTEKIENPCFNEVRDNDLKESELVEWYNRMFTKLYQKQNQGKLKKYLDLCVNSSNNYQSASEADWSFCILVNDLIDKKLSFRHKYQIIEYCFFRSRKERPKNRRKDYIERTITKAIHYNLEKSNQIENEQSKKELLSIHLCNQVKSNAVKQETVIKMCNTLQIFHLGRSVRNYYYYNENKNNTLKATIPYSLNQRDFRYYMQILFQYIDTASKTENIIADNNRFCHINISQVLKSINAFSISGRSYRDFKKSLDKLSDVVLEYNKQINKDDNIRHVSKESLLSYRYQYQGVNKSDEISNTERSQKLYVKMHPIIMEMLKRGTYNYALFNRESYNELPSDKLKLLYYHFSSLTLPGEHPVIFSLEDLLKLWPESNVVKTNEVRKKDLICLLMELVKVQSSIKDLCFNLMMRSSKVVGIKVKKRQLRLI